MWGNILENLYSRPTSFLGQVQIVGWLVGAIIFLVHFLGPFSGNMILPMFNVLKSDFNVEVFLLGLSVTVYMVPFSITQLFSGLLSDLFYGRKNTIIGGSILSCLGFLLAAFSPTIWIFLVARVIQGVGAAFIAPVAMAMVGDFFSREVRGKIMGGVAVSTTLGGALGPLIGGFFANFDWRLGFIVLALATASVTFLVFIAIPSNQKQHATGRDGGDEALKVLWEVLTRKEVLGVGFLGFILFFIRISVYTYLSDILTLKPYSLPSHIIGCLLALAGFGGLVAGLISGYLTDKIGRKKIATIGFLMVLTVLCFYLTAEWYAILPFLLFSMGFSITTAFTPINTMAVEVYPKYRAAATSIYGSMRFLGYALGPMLAYPFYVIGLIGGVAILSIGTTIFGLLLLLKLKTT